MVALSRRWSWAISSRVLTRSAASEVGQRLVEQEQLRLAHHGAADGHALALAARKLGRAALR